MQAEQERIEAERGGAERWSETAKRQVEDVDQALADALALIDVSTAPYLTANPLERRLINLAIYLMLLVSHPDTVEAQPTAFYAQLVALARKLAQEAAQERQQPPQAPQTPGNRPQNDHDPVRRGRGSQYIRMAERPGRVANRHGQTKALVGLLMEPAGRQARRLAAEAIVKQGANSPGIKVRLSRSIQVARRSSI
jgi:hypothetical protein